MRSVSIRPISYRSTLKQFTSPKKTLALISLAVTLLSIARVVVCLVESYSAVTLERHADNDLIKVCDSGEAAQSTDFRTLCMKKRAERAAPVVLKAMLRAVTSAFCEFCEIFGSTTRIALLVLFCITGVSAPVAKALAALFVQNLRQRRQKYQNRHSARSDSDSDSDDGTNEFLAVDVGTRYNPRHNHNTRQRIQYSLNRSLRSAAERCGLEPIELGLLKED